jgi:hypothetical protein
MELDGFILYYHLSCRAWRNAVASPHTGASGELDDVFNQLRSRRAKGITLGHSCLGSSFVFGSLQFPPHALSQHPKLYSEF